VRVAAAYSRTVSVLIWFLLVVLGFGAFGSVGSAVVESGGGELPAPSATEVPGSSSDPYPDDLPFPGTNRDIQQRYQTRSPLPGCGFVDLTSDPGDSSADEAWSCLQDAVGGDAGAELMVFDFGDTMTTTTYRVNPDGPLEVFADTAQVPGTAPRWQYRQCEPSADLRTEPCAS
jgi:hypothetical protein